MPSKTPRLAVVGEDRWNVQESRSVRSVWVWRGFFMMSLVAIGITIIFATNDRTMLAVGWGIISAGWFAVSMWLWYQHNRWYDSDRLNQ
jgi:hypothetical protein